jgi:hypothetical protein
MFPLASDVRDTDGREADVTFRLALIARILGWELSWS